ncbi:MAG: mechanosensitive ion channel family protein [Oscillospiraceae bacterium]|nr:mechanosensitive ion channel family protein [Oscillospiraceae bacterium]
MQRLYDLFGIDNVQLATSILGIIAALTLLVVSLKLTKRLFRRAERRLQANGRDVTSLRYLRYVVKALLYIVCLAGALQNVPGMDSVMTSLLAGSGIAAIVVGFASQQALSNIVSGMVLLIFRPFKVGDRVCYHGPDLIGVIEEIGLRHTVVRAETRSQILIPNSLMNSHVIEVLPEGVNPAAEEESVPAE